MTARLSATMPDTRRNAAVSARRPSLEDIEEDRFLVRARIGDAEALTWLLNRHRARALRLANHVLRRPDEAEDAAQEAFIRAFRSIRSFRGECRFSTWLLRIVVRVCLDRRRRKRWDAEGPLDEAFTAAAPGPSPDARMLVEALLDRLSPPMRAALVLREIEGLEYEEIAATLNIPVGTVRSRLNTARARFREMWLRIQEETDHVG